MLNSFRVSWRNITRHKKRFLFTLIAIALGVSVMTSMFIAKATFSNIMDEQEKLTAGNADFKILGTERFFSVNDLGDLLDRDEVTEGIALLTKQGFVDMETDSPMQATVNFTGLSDFQNDIMPLSVKKGDVTKEGLILTENTATLWGKDIGDIVSFQNMGSLEVTAIVYEGGVLNSPKTMEAANYRDFEVIVPLTILQEWVGMSQQITELRFQVDGILDPQELLADYERNFAGSNLFVQPVVVDTKQYNIVDGMYFVFDLIAILSIFISAFIAFNMIRTSIIERNNEIAIMKSLGYTSRNVVQLILKEIGFLAGIGTVLGIGIGVWLGMVVQEILISSIVTQNITYEVEIVSPMIISAIIGIVFPFIAAAIPIYKAGKIPILDAMAGQKNESVNKINIPRVIIGVLCTVLGLIDNVWAFLLLFIGLVLLFPLWMKLTRYVLRPIIVMLFGFLGNQADCSLKQFEKRNANTAAMLAIGVSLALFMSATLESLPVGLEKDIRATFGGDIIVEKENAWTKNEIEALATIEGIEKVDDYAEIPNVTWYSPDDELREFSILSFSDNNGASMFDLIETIDETSDMPSVYIGDRALAEMGAVVGDIFTFHTPAGETELFIKGTVHSAHYSGYVGFVEEPLVQDFLNWPWNYHIAIDVADEETIPIVLASLWASYGDSIANVDMMQLNIEQAKSGLEGMNDLIVALLILVIAISAIGISNTLFMNTLERTKELGTMRALGFTKSQVRIMIIAEGLLIGITGVVVGILYGILVIYLNATSNQAPAFLEFSVPWSSLVISVAGGIVFTLLASWIPSNSASKISIREAINYG
ncbi:FtsX-like permease family protein [Ornithinibacillus massiliensis]|uniref:FtsX-like permease family protein n=1 Tax=Ornithinibacillus massiliensis TaxID=1944633 RepID=A0ABS5MF25_9BACI|nr:FtsX-like permease family protein [Ornithinibacillus massiliensis]MBS3680935.1 FtsX-like permease family protein [Ornithinibacillus massiliensis]